MRSVEYVIGACRACGAATGSTGPRGRAGGYREQGGGPGQTRGVRARRAFRHPRDRRGATGRGYRVARVEAHDIAKGTSSRSTKLVHGGMRYLARGDIALMREALVERGRLMRTAPHLVRRLEFVVPAYARWARPYYGLGLKVYDLLAGRLGLGASRPLARADTLARIPTLEAAGLGGGVTYYDDQFDDARMAVTLALTAVGRSAVLAMYAPVVRLLHRVGQRADVVVRDEETGRELEVWARVVVNAAGGFADAVRRLDDPDCVPMLSLSQGIHLVVPRAFLPGTSVLMVPKTDDGRVLFTVPWHGRTIIGATDTGVPAADLEPRPLDGEIDFLLGHAARYLGRAPAREDALSAYAGLRPLIRAGVGGRIAALSREQAILVSRGGLVTIVGGKWTTYRKMDEDVVTRAAGVAGLARRPPATDALRLRGAPVGTREGVDGPLATGAQDDIMVLYGTDADRIRALARVEFALERALHPRLPYVMAQVTWAVREEMARTLEGAPAVARFMSTELGRDAAWQEVQLAAFRERMSASLLSPISATARVAG